MRPVGLAAAAAAAVSLLLVPGSHAGVCLGDPLEIVVAPAATDPGIDQYLDDHYVYVHPDLPLRGELVVWLPGSCGRPENYRMILREAALQGYRTIGLRYANCPSLAALCHPEQPGDPDCYEDVRRERLDGAQHTDVIDLDESPANSISNRLVKLLLHLETIDPGRGWASFVDGGAPRWSDMVLAGHSQGGGYPPLVALDHLVGRVVMFAGTDTLPAGGGPAPWTSKPHVTPSDRYFVVGHVRDNLLAKLSVWDALGVPGVVIDADSTPEPFDGGHRLVTNLQPETGDDDDVHGSIAGDRATPLGADGATPLLAPVWRYVLGASTDEVVLVPTKILKLADGVEAERPKKRSVRFKSDTKSETAERRIVLPAVGSLGDPTLHGARLQVMNAADSGELADVHLPASGWILLGTPVFPKGYRYRGEPDAAIDKVVLKTNRVTVKGRGAEWCYTLDEPSQVRMGVRLRFGDALVLCAEASARTSGNPPSTATHDLVDRFRSAKDAAAPLVCPQPPRPPL